MSNLVICWNKQSVFSKNGIELKRIHKHKLNLHKKRQKPKPVMGPFITLNREQCLWCQIKQLDQMLSRTFKYNLTFLLTRHALSNMRKMISACNFWCFWWNHSFRITLSFCDDSPGTTPVGFFRCIFPLAAVCLKTLNFHFRLKTHWPTTELSKIFEIMTVKLKRAKCFLSFFLFFLRRKCFTRQKRSHSSLKIYSGPKQIPVSLSHFPTDKPIQYTKWHIPHKAYTCTRGALPQQVNLYSLKPEQQPLMEPEMTDGFICHASSPRQWL